MLESAGEKKGALERERERREQAEEEEVRVKELLAKEKKGAQNLREQLDLESAARKMVSLPCLHALASFPPLSPRIIRISPASPP